MCLSLWSMDGAVPPAKGSEIAQRLVNCAKACEEARKSTEDKVRDRLFQSSFFVTWEMVQLAISICPERERVEYYVAITEADVQLAHMFIRERSIWLFLRILI